MITPFMAFASTMQGFDAPKAAYVLVATLLTLIVLPVMYVTWLGGTVASGQHRDAGSSPNDASGSEPVTPEVG